MRHALQELGTERAMVFYGDDGLDELTTTTTSTVYELVDGEVCTYPIDPVELGLAQSSHDELVGADATANARAVEAVLAGEPGAHRDIAMLHAAAAIVVAGRAPGLPRGVARAATPRDARNGARAVAPPGPPRAPAS